MYGLRETLNLVSGPRPEILPNVKLDANRCTDHTKFNEDRFDVLTLLVKTHVPNDIIGLILKFILKKAETHTE
jgi:hypothetical protein